MNCLPAGYMDQLAGSEARYENEPTPCDLTPDEFTARLQSKQEPPDHHNPTSATSGKPLLE